MAMTLTAEDRERLRQLWETVTVAEPEPWVVHFAEHGRARRYYDVVRVVEGFPVACELPDATSADAVRAEFIAQSHNALPSLLADSETLAKLREMRERIASELGYGCPVCHFWSETKHSLDCWLSDLLALLAPAPQTGKER